MIQELQKYSKAWGEFIEWMGDKHWDYDDDNFSFVYSSKGRIIENFISNRQLQSYLIEWLDSKGVYVMYDISDKNLFHWAIVLGDDIYSMPILQSDREYTKTRTEATEQGIKRAFEILEGK